MTTFGRELGSSAAMFAALALGLVLVGCREPAKPVVFRLPPAAPAKGSITALTVAGSTRNGLILPVRDGVGRVAFTAEDLAPGNIRVEVAAPPHTGPANADLTITLRATDLRSRVLRSEPVSCRGRWSGGMESGATGSAWKSCDLSVPRPLSTAVVEVVVEAGGDGDLYVAQPLYAPRARTSQPDVYVLLIDTVRADKLRPFSETLPIGERFVGLARDAITFDKLRSSSSWTRTAVATLFTGLRADRHKVYGRLDVLGDGLASLPALLQQQGYVTTAWSANPNVLPMWGFARGFDVFRDVGAEEWAGQKTDGEALFAAVRGDIDAAPSAPGFYYVHLMDAHAPYVPPAEDRQVIEEIDSVATTFPRPLGVLAALKEYDLYKSYLGELVDLDRAVGRFIAWLEDTGRYDNSLILVVSDHGEEFIDHGGMHHGRTLYEEMLHVPAMLKLPGSRGAAAKIDDAVAFEDLLPTLLAGIGLPAPPGQLDGCNALDGKCRGRPHFAELRLDGNSLASAIVEPWKVIVDQNSRRRELYDLSVDPLERRNLTFANPDKLAEMERILSAAISRTAHGWHLLACGGDNTAELAFSLNGAVAMLVESALEEEDTITVRGESELAVLFTLRPYDAPREFFGRLIAQRQRDEDELRLEQESSASPLRLESEAELRLVVGASKHVTTTRALDLSALRTEASVPATSAITCPPTPPAFTNLADAVLGKRTPFLRIWYVEPPATLSAEEVDPAVADRLRALGYVW